MTISSRTPEGELNHCPVCGQACRLEPSEPAGDAPCPACGVLLWYLREGAALWYWPAPDQHRLDLNDLRHRTELLRELIRQFPDRSADLSGLFNDLGLDSLELVEAVMELEDEVG